MFSCTECGRCSSFCPATATGKPLAPRQFLLDLRDSVYALERQLRKASPGENSFDCIVGDGKSVRDEVVWSCVACRACEEACPVNIEYVEKIVDIRQHLVQEASRFPEEIGRAFRGMETQSNPWGISSSERSAWAEGLNVPLISEHPDAEYLYYVGCGGAFDANNRKATRAFASLLTRAGVSFAILGNEELCNGETARRLGNEYLFQSMAEALSKLLKKHNVKKILVNCPHCFNTLKNEYPDFGGKWQVDHAAAFVGKLVENGKLRLEGDFEKRVVYHDSCYYGRFNDIYDEPRNLLQKIRGLKLVEMFFCRHQGTCCGAGGGRMWMEEKADQRVNLLRTGQALDKKPDVVCTSCPYCRIMIGSGINEKGLSEQVQVLDVMELVGLKATDTPGKVCDQSVAQISS
jgi:Fe-S oxidoreductase